MAELKTKATNLSVEDFINNITEEEKRDDAFELVKMMKQATKSAPKMWGPAIIGFGDYHYKYESGRENDWFVMGFSPRKQNFALYFMSGFDGGDSLFKKLGKYKVSKGCLYIKRLSDVDTTVLKSWMEKSAKQLKS